MTSRKFQITYNVFTIFIFLSTFPSRGKANYGLTKCEELYLEGDLSLCRVILEEDTDSIGEFQILQAEGSIKLKTQLYPSDKSFHDSLISYDEPATMYPLPLGPSVWLCCILGLLCLYYMSAFLRTVLSKVKKEMNLRPHTAKFPSLPLYWLQQSKREISLRREFRNTWAWLAKRYLLSPDDPLLGDIDEVMGRTTWADFHVPRGTWSTIDVTLKLNHLCLETEENADGQKVYKVRRIKTDKPQKLQLYTILAKLKTQFGNLDQAQKDRQEEKQVQEIESQIGSGSSGESHQTENEIDMLVKEAMKTNAPLPIEIEDQHKRSKLRLGPLAAARRRTLRFGKTPPESRFKGMQPASILKSNPGTPPPPMRLLRGAPVHKVKPVEVKPLAFTSKKVEDMQKLKEKIQSQMNITSNTEKPKLPMNQNLNKPLVHTDSKPQLGKTLSQTKQNPDQQKNLVKLPTNQGNSNKETKAIPLAAEPRKYNLYNTSNQSSKSPVKPKQQKSPVKKTFPIKKSSPKKSLVNIKTNGANKEIPTAKVPSKVIVPEVSGDSNHPLKTVTEVTNNTKVVTDLQPRPPDQRNPPVNQSKSKPEKSKKKSPGHKQFRSKTHGHK